MNKCMTDDEIDVLSESSDQIGRLYSEKKWFFKKLSTTLKMNKDGWGESKKDAPDDRSVKSYIVEIRPFLQQDSAINVYRTLNIVMNPDNKVDIKIREKAREARRVWKIVSGDDGKELRAGIGFVHSGKNVTQREMLDLWLNGKYFHQKDRIESEYKELRNLQDNPFIHVFYVAFLKTIQDLSRLLFWIEYNIVAPTMGRKPNMRDD